jgi:hypothetical protein
VSAAKPAPDAVEAALDKLEKILSDLGLPATEQEAVPAARAEHAALLARAEAQRVALDAIGHLWPEPPNCAAINPEWVGPNDGKNRAILLEEAIRIARAARAKVQP